MKIIDLENWLSNFPDLMELRFSINGKEVQWTGGTKVSTFPSERGDLSKVEEVVTLEFK